MGVEWFRVWGVGGCRISGLGCSVHRHRSCIELYGFALASWVLYNFRLSRLEGLGSRACGVGFRLAVDCSNQNQYHPEP